MLQRCVTIMIIVMAIVIIMMIPHNNENCTGAGDNTNGDVDGNDSYTRSNEHTTYNTNPR